MNYRYRAVNREGTITSGNLQANGEEALAAILSGRGLELIAARATRPWQNQHVAIDRRELINFCFQLELLCRAGVPLLEALRDLGAATESHRFRQTLTELADSLAGGSTFSQALALHPKCFDSLFIQLIRAGETSGHLPSVLQQLGETLRREYEFRRQIRRALLYPTFLAILLVTVIGFLMTSLVPQLRQFVATTGQTLPLHSRLLFSLADTCAAGWPWFLLALAATALTATFCLQKNPGIRLWFDRKTLSIPLLGPLLLKTELCRMANTLATLYAAGIPILEALGEARKTLTNRALQMALEKAQTAISGGAGLAQSFAQSQLFPTLIIRMLQLGEHTGALDQSLRQAIHFFQRDIDDALAHMQTLTEPLLTVVLGLILGWITLSVLGPIYELISKIT